MGDPHRRVGGVHALPARAGGPVDVDAQVLLVDLDLDVLGLGVDEHAGGGGVHPPLRLGDRHALHPVHAAFELQLRPHAVRAGVGLGLHRDGDVLEAAEVGFGAVQHLGLPALALGEAQVHAQQVAGEQRGFLAALAGLDLQHHVGGVARVAGQQQFGEPVVQFVDRFGQPVGLLGERRVLLGELPRGDQVGTGLVEFPRAPHDRGQFGVAAAELARVGLVGVHVRV